jgi:L-asparagine oxygenase
VVCRIKQFRLRKSEIQNIDELLRTILKSKHTLDLQSFLKYAALVGHELPKRVRKALYEFKLLESSEVLIVNNYPIDSSLIGKTPGKHKAPGQEEVINRYEVLHVLFASLLGEPFGWTTIQHGYIMDDVMPVAAHRRLVASSGSDSLFDLHSEDAFHPYAGDYLGLLCLRNPSNVSTIFSSILPSDLSKKSTAILFEPRFIVGANIAQKVPVIESPSPIFFGSRNKPYIHINFNLTHSLKGDFEGEKALQELRSALMRNSIKINLQPGYFCYIDNYRTLHGREAFRPTFDGKDRWLKRLYISSSFRRSAAFRHRPEERVINPNAINWTWNN